MQNWLDIDAVLAESNTWPLLKPATSYQCQPLTLGLSNRCYLLEGAEEKLIIRINNPSSHHFGVNYQQEKLILGALKTTSFAPKTLFADPQYRYLVSHYIEGQPWSELTPNQRDTSALPKLIGKIQQTSIDLPTFNYHAHLLNYWQQLVDLDLIDGELNERWQQAQTRLSQWAQLTYQPALCHHDINPSNLIQRDDQLFLLDWEFARLGHPLFDVIYSNATYSNTIETPTIVDREQTSELYEQSLVFETIQWINQLWNLLHQHYHF